MASKSGKRGNRKKTAPKGAKTGGDGSESAALLNTVEENTNRETVGGGGEGQPERAAVGKSRFTKVARERGLAALSAQGTVTAAAQASGVARITWHERLTPESPRYDPQLAAEVADARDAFRESLVAEAIRRGVNGWTEPVFHRGNEIGAKPLYSDMLLRELLRAHDPSFRSDGRVGVEVTSSGTDGAQSQRVRVVVDHSGMADDERALLRRMAQRQVLELPPGGGDDGEEGEG